LIKVYYIHVHIFFPDNEIDFDCFKTLTKEEVGDLVEGKIGPRNKIYAEIERIRAIDAGITKVTEAEVESKPTAPPQSLTMQTPPPSYASAAGKPAFPTSGGSGKMTTGPPQQTSAPPPPPQATQAEQSLLDKYGFTLPSAGE
jgi:hypothetical protein